MSHGPLALFTLSSSADYAKRVSQFLEAPLYPIEERAFEDGEHKIRPLVSVEGADAFVIHALHGDGNESVNDKLCRMLFLIGTLKDHGAARVTTVLPYLCYARKDRRTQPHDPVTSRYVAALFEAVGTDRVFAVEVHNVAAFENAFNRPTLHIETGTIFAEHFAALARKERIVVVSPDAGGVKRAERFRRALESASPNAIDNAFIEKYRAGGVVSGGALIGSVQGKTAIVIDDLISTGGTLLRAARACRAAGAARVFAAAAHGLFVGGAPDLFAGTEFDGFAVADTVPIGEQVTRAAGDRLAIVKSATLVGSAIAKAHGGA